jgi:hypothetical protein
MTRLTNSTNSKCISKKVCYICEPSNASLIKAHKIKCIVYSCDPTGNVTYAVCMFKRKSGKDIFVKLKHRQIAEMRFNEFPKTLTIDNFDVAKGEKPIIRSLDLASENVV